MNEMEVTEMDTQCKNSTIQCDQCSFTHQNQKVMNVHAMVHSTEPIPYGCPYCTFDTVWRDCMRSHINTKHSRIKRIKQCPYCNFKTVHKIENHIEQHHKDSLRFCNFCKFKAMDKLEIIDHIIVNHPEEESYKCWDCPYKTKNLKSLNVHFQNKHIREVFPCKFCKYSTLKKHDLIKHENYVHVRKTMHK